MARLSHFLTCQPGQRVPGSLVPPLDGAPWSYADVCSPTIIVIAEDVHLHP